MFNENHVQTDLLYNRDTGKTAKHYRLSRMLSELGNKQQHQTGGVKTHKTTKDIGDICEGLRKNHNLLSHWTRFVHNMRIKSLASITCQVVSETSRYTFRISLALTLWALRTRGVRDDIVQRTRSSLYRTADRMKKPYIVREYHSVNSPGAPAEARATRGGDKKRSIFQKSPIHFYLHPNRKKKSNIHRNYTLHY